MAEPFEKVQLLLCSNCCYNDIIRLLLRRFFAPKALHLVYVTHGTVFHFLDYIEMIEKTFGWIKWESNPGRSCCLRLWLLHLAIPTHRCRSYLKQQP